MTDQEIDMWVEEHVVFTNPNATPENRRIAMDATKKIARRFYKIGKEEGKKIVDYTAAFVGKWKDEPILKPKEDIEQAAARYERENRQSVLTSVDIVNAFIEGARWMEGRR